MGSRGRDWAAAHHCSSQALVTRLTIAPTTFFSVNGVAKSLTPIKVDNKKFRKRSLEIKTFRTRTDGQDEVLKKCGQISAHLCVGRKTSVP